MNSLVNEELYGSLHPVLVDLIDRGFVLSYLSNGDGDDVVLDIEREFDGFDWTIVFEKGNPAKISICSEILTGFDRLRDHYLGIRGVISQDAVDSIVDEMEKSFGKVTDFVSDQGIEGRIVGRQTDGIHGFYELTVDLDRVLEDDNGVGKLEDVWNVLGEYNRDAYDLIEKNGSYID